MENDEYASKSNSIRQLSALQPDVFADKMAEIHPNIANVAPNIAPHIHTAATNAVQYLNSKLPGAGNELLQDRDYKTSASQKRAWLELHNTVDNPTSILERVNNGTLTQPHIDAVKAVYPDLHQEMVDKVKEQLGNLKVKGQRLPYKKRAAVAKLIGEPIDSTMTQANKMAILAANKSPQQSQQGQQNGKASSAELTQINKVNKIYATPDQSRQIHK